MGEQEMGQSNRHGSRTVKNDKPTLGRVVRRDPRPIAAKVTHFVRPRRGGAACLKRRIFMNNPRDANNDAVIRHAPGRCSVGFGDLIRAPTKGRLINFGRCDFPNETLTNGFGMSCKTRESSAKKFVCSERSRARTPRKLGISQRFYPEKVTYLLSFYIPLNVNDWGHSNVGPRL
ncbi:hypothetical protein EVAR_31299_1 [Eumeta japonica]|uniref:Uncharacterized protein n=1 Tax=Eumeta variegata TaxID=151549 RepID=A0A4C1VTM1_EUMVA|nr:hypothetical protein EVAR_31299_1 [Eumeta japonica]